MFSDKLLIKLTTILSALILTIVFFNSCTRRTDLYNQSMKAEDAMYGWYYLDYYTKYRIIRIDDHEYLIFKSNQYSGVKSISVIHSESCPCKKKKNN